jgi:hypothetical protein
MLENQEFVVSNPWRSRRNWAFRAVCQSFNGQNPSHVPTGSAAGRVRYVMKVVWVVAHLCRLYPELAYPPRGVKHYFPNSAFLS